MKKKFGYILFSIALTWGFLASCTDEWNIHYNDTTIVNKSSLNLYEYIQAQPELKTFSRMIKIAGYDTILNKSQTYTVWAPVNSVLENVDTTNTNTVAEIVNNHISRFSYPTSGLTTKTVYMLDKKFISFKKEDNGYTFGGKMLLYDKSNVAVSNGIVHLINGYVPYMSNIWEYIGKTAGLDSLRNYLYSQSVYQFDPKASVEIGTNSHGQSIYDSIITFTNPVLDQIGHLQIEDSTFTTILPNNIAWTRAFNQIKSKYNTLPADGGAPQQRLNTQMAIVKNLVFKQLVADTTSFDSLISTTGSIIKHPGYLFGGATKTELSNGLAYTTDSLRFKPEDSYQKDIKIEAENSSYGRAYRFANLYVRSSLGSTFSTSVSNYKYLVAEPTTVSAYTPNSVVFPIPNTLSGKYNIYCVFVPSSIINTTDARPYKVKFYFTGLNSTGSRLDSIPIDKNHLLNTKTTTAAIFTTTPSQISKVLVTQYQFPYCNLYGDNSTSASITTKIKVENAAKITESVNFDQTLRIDYLILEPVP